jgi:hypothetical protein
VCSDRRQLIDNIIITVTVSLTATVVGCWIPGSSATLWGARLPKGRTMAAKPLGVLGPSRVLLTPVESPHKPVC